MRPQWHARKGDVFNPDRTWGIVTEWTREECDALGDPPDTPLRTTVIAEVMAGPTDEDDAKLIAKAANHYAELVAALQAAHDTLLMHRMGMLTSTRGYKMAKEVLDKVAPVKPMPNLMETEQ